MQSVQNNACNSYNMGTPSGYIIQCLLQSPKRLQYIIYLTKLITLGELIKWMTAVTVRTRKERHFVLMWKTQPPDLPKSRILPLVLRLVALPSAFSFETIVFSTSGITIETTWDPPLLPSVFPLSAGEGASTRRQCGVKILVFWKKYMYHNNSKFATLEKPIHE